MKAWPSKSDLPDEWIIHGKRYNLKPFYSMHPGGAYVLRSAKGSDCTGLFESCHTFIDSEVLLKMAAKYEITGGEPPSSPSTTCADPFYTDVKDMARDHFKGKGKGAHKMTWPRLFLCSV